MLVVGHKHTLDFEGFKKWHLDNDKEHLNGASNFIETKTYNTLFLTNKQEDYSDEYGEVLYYFNKSKKCEVQSSVDIWFWNESLKFFTPIKDLVQEEMEI